MLFDEAGEVVELFRNSFPFSFLFFVPIFIILSPMPASAAHEFAVYRMQQFDLHGSSYGCRNSLVNVEARSIESTVFTRRCVVAKLRDVTYEKYKDMLVQNAGGLLVLLPEQLHSLLPQDQQKVLELEQELMEQDTQVPVYFAQETEELLEIYDQISTSVNSDQAGSALEAMMSSATANGFQMVISGSQSKALADFELVNIQGKLAGHGIEEQLPTIAVVAHYDAFGISPSLAKGADSNGSGVVALLELSRLFSKLYMNSRTHAKFNVIFLLSAGGKFNYQGTKRWIEDQFDSADSSLLLDVSYVLCLDSIGNGDEIYMHVSKPPKEGSSGESIMQHLEQATKDFRKGAKFEMIHKKINLADDVLAWEHERFSIRRLPGYTVSHFNSHRAPERNSILDTREIVNSKILAANIKILAEALGRHIYNLSHTEEPEIFQQGLTVEQPVVEAWIDFLSRHSRAAQLLEKDKHIVNTLEQAMSRHLKDVQRHSFRADKRDPEFMFYDGAEYTMTAYNVKPAVFDLFLALGIAAYLSLLYLFVQNFSFFYMMFKKYMAKPKMHQNGKIKSN